MGKEACHVSSDWLLIVLDRSTLPKFESAKMFCQNLTRCACADIFIIVSCSGDSKMKVLFKHVWEDVLHCRKAEKPYYFSFTGMR